MAAQKIKKTMKRNPEIRVLHHFNATFDICLTVSTPCRRIMDSHINPVSPFTHSLSPYVGQSMCIDIFSVYGSPESRIGDHPRNRLSHFNAP